MSGDVLQDLFGLKGQVALVTGAGSGIGKGIARRLAQAGADVALSDVNEQKAAALSRELSGVGVRSIPVGGDVSDEKAVCEMVGEVASQLGRIDILVNNAGIYPTGPVAEMDVGDWDRVMAVNLRGPLLCMREVVKVMRRHKRGGSILNVSSIDSMHPSFVGMSHYGASKGGLNMLTRSAALEFAPDNITVNAICPGGVETEGTQEAFGDGLKEQLEQRIPLGRVSTPDEIGGVSLFLVSPAARYITGATLVVDGGYLIS